MNSFLNTIKYDYLQRTRSYAFLITLCFSLAIAYTFVPEPNANYSTIRIADYIGHYNSAWFGYVTAIMTSVFLSLIGFYLINSGIKRDITTKVGQIVAATPIKNFKYLLGKTISNFAVLSTIVLVVFLMSVLLFILYNDGSPFELWHFVKPYLLITLPSVFFVGVLAVVFEVVLGKYSILQNIGFFFLFSVLLLTPPGDAYFTLDVFGTKIVIQQMEETVRTLNDVDGEMNMSIGYVIGNRGESKRFEFSGVDFPYQFILGRLALLFIGLVLIAAISPFFHRFAFRERVVTKMMKATISSNPNENEIMLSRLPEPQTNYGILTLLKTEILLLISHGKKWLWFVNVLGMLLLAFLPLEIAHQFVLPVLWFLQVGRLSQLTTKELTYGVHYFAFTSYKPLSRLLLSQLIAGVSLMIVLCSPVLVRYSFILDFSAVVSIVLGGIMIVLFAAFLGMLTKGKKLFEVLFFMITYANINSIVFLDYFGASPHGYLYPLKLILISIGLGVLSFLWRNYDLKR